MAQGRLLGAEANRRIADEAYSDILPDMVAWRAQGDTLEAIADHLNFDGQTTRRGKPWTRATVANVLRRAGSARIVTNSTRHDAGFFYALTTLRELRATGPMLTPAI